MKTSMKIEQNKTYKNEKNSEYWLEKEDKVTYYLCIKPKVLHCPCYRNKPGQSDIYYSDLGGFEPKGGPNIYVGGDYGFGVVRRLAKIEDNCLEITVFED